MEIISTKTAAKILMGGNDEPKYMMCICRPKGSCRGKCQSGYILAEKKLSISDIRNK